MGGRCLCCCGMPHGCDWPAPRRVSSARRSDSGQRNSPGLNAQPEAPARAGASHGACNAPECSPRLAQMRPSSPPIVHRLLKKHSDECGTGDAWQAGHDAVIGCYVPSVTLCVSGIVRAVHQSSSKLGDTPLVRLDPFLSHCLPGGLAVEPLQQTLQQNRALHRSTTHAVRHAADVELYSSTALQSALHLYSSTALYTLHPLHPAPSGCSVP